MQAQARQVRHSPAHVHPLPPHRCILCVASGSADRARTDRARTDKLCMLQDVPAVAELVRSLTTQEPGSQQEVHHLFRRPAMSMSALFTLLQKAQLKASPHISGIDAELVRFAKSAFCYTFPDMPLRLVGPSAVLCLNMIRTPVQCFNVELSEALSESEAEKLCW